MEELKDILTLFYQAVRNKPDDARTAMAWLMKNKDFLEKSLVVDDTSAEEREANLKSAWEEEDYMLWVLLLYQKYRQEHPSGEGFL